MLAIPQPGRHFGRREPTTICLIAARQSRVQNVAMDPNALACMKRLAGKSTLVLTHYGRKTGKPYEVKIWFVVDGHEVFIGTANVEHQWIKNVQKNPRIKLSVGGEKFDAEARFLTDPARATMRSQRQEGNTGRTRGIFALGKILIALGLMRHRTGAFEVTLLSG
jgi:deazaflavin-dependent oxidoreductase (nitroreductase family)